MRLAFLLWDVWPAVQARRRQPQADVISYMLEQKKSLTDIWVECIVYGAAGMATTQEFISVVFWHCMQNPAYQAIMRSDNQAARHELLHELLRLEPVVSDLYRQTQEPVSVTSAGQTYDLPAGANIHFHIQDINTDAQVVHAEPHRVQPHRELEKGTSRSMLGFGAGSHRCAGEFVALWETDIFLQKLLALPNLRVVSGPTLRRNPTVESYEIRDFVIACD